VVRVKCEEALRFATTEAWYGDIRRPMRGARIKRIWL
jgi:hypothetical protein